MFVYKPTKNTHINVFSIVRYGVDQPSVEAFTATNLSKFSSTSIRIASERESRTLRRWDVPEAKSWYVAFGCTAERKAVGSNDFEDIRMAASKYYSALGEIGF